MCDNEITSTRDENGIDEKCDEEKNYQEMNNEKASNTIKMMDRIKSCPSKGAAFEKADVGYTLDPSGGIAGVKTFEDLLEIVGTTGPWNIMVFVIGCYCTFTKPMISICYQFVGAIPDHWCSVDILSNAHWSQQQVIDLAIPKKNGMEEHERCLMYNYNYTLAVNLGYEGSMANRDLISLGNDSHITCSSRDFNYTQYESTLATEWDLVCERLFLYSTTQTVSQMGFLLGSVIISYLLDLFGRRKVTLVCIIGGLVSSLSLGAAPAYEIYVLLKTLTSIFFMGFYIGSFITLMELCSLKQRSLVGSMYVIPFALGYMTVPGIAYFIRPWRWLHMALAFPTLPLLSYFWLFPESPRWLISEGRYQEALKVLSWAAQVNRRCPLPPSEALLISMKNIKLESEESPQAEEQTIEIGTESLCSLIWSKIRRLFVFIIKPELRVRTLICYFCWFSVAMVYYGVSLNSTNLSTDPYLYLFLGGLVEVVAYLLLWVAITYLGRKRPLITFYLLCAFTISIIGITMATMEEVSSAVIMSLSLIGKLGITAAFHLIYVYTAELFPTKYRSLAVGESCMMGRFGSMSSSYINDILGELIDWGPSALFALMSLAAAALSSLLPETKDTHLPEENDLRKKHAKKLTGKLENQHQDIEAKKK